MMSRVDLAVYANGCQTLQNFVPKKQGPAGRRMGTHYVKPTKNSAARSWIGRFVFDNNDAYILEFGDFYIRFYAQGGQIESAPGTPLEVVTPWPVAALTREDGTFSLQSAQSGDVVWFAGAGVSPQKVSRKAALDWEIVPFLPDTGPFLAMNKVAATVVTSDAVTGAITITATADIFEAGHVGGLMRLTDQKPAEVQPWQSGESVNFGQFRRSDGKVYKCTSTDTTGRTPPDWSEGSGSDGGTSWLFINAGYGTVRITAVNSPTEAAADVLVDLPASVGSTGTKYFEFGAWSDAAGWPEAVSFHGPRLVFARNRWRWFSVSDDYENYASKDANEVLPESAITIRVNGDGVNVTKWMADSEVLICGTNGGIDSVGKITATEPFGPGNVVSRPMASIGSSWVKGRLVNDRVLYVDATNEAVREISYRIEAEAYEAKDLNRMASHILSSGVISVAWQGPPDNVLWCVLGNGSLAAMTYEQSEQVFGWHMHGFSNGETFECVETIPLDGGGGDEVWFQANDGHGGRSILRMERQWKHGGSRADAFFVDYGLIYEGAPTKEISGLEINEGRTVAVLADGAVPFSPDLRPVVTDGKITIPIAASKVVVGLPYMSILQPMLVEAGAPEGTAQGRRKRAHKVFFRVQDTRGVSVGPSMDKLTRMGKRDPSTPMGTPEPLDTGLFEARAWEGNYVPDMNIFVATDEPLPATILAIMPRLTAHD